MSTPRYYENPSGDLISRCASSLEKQEFREVMRFNIMKYAERAGKKTESPLEDLQKIIEYSKRWIEYEEV